MSLALVNGTIFTGEKEKKNILIEKGKIKSITKNKVKADKVIDCKGKLILPGAIDNHVHFRQPGQEYKEDFFSGSLAAVHGGVTSVMDMPNNNPFTDSAERLEKKRKMASKAIVNIDFFLAPKNEKEVMKAKKLRGIKVYWGSTFGSKAENDLEKTRKIFEAAKRKGVRVTVHAEDEQIIKENSEKFANEKEVSVHTKIRSVEAEVKAIRDVLQLQSEVGNKLNFAHVSSGKGLELIVEAKKKQGKKVSCESAPQYLFLDGSYYKKLGTFMKCNPAIKSKKEREKLWNGLVKGEIDFVATDHAPHAFSEKEQGYWKSPSGVPGIETMVPLMIDAVNKKKISLKRMVEVVSEKPAELFEWEGKGKIKRGYDADLIIVDMNRERTLRNELLFTKADYTPFNNWKLKGVIEKTIVGGNVYG